MRVLASQTGGWASAVVQAAGSRTFTPSVHCQPTQFNQALLALCPTLVAPYRLPTLLCNGNVETLFAAFLRQKPHLLFDREILHLPDGGCVALDTEDLPPEAGLPPDAPVLILLPGLTGGSEDTYVQHGVVHAREAGFRAIVFNSRGTSESPVKSAQFYSASYTGDLRNVVMHVAAKYPGVPLLAAGWSVGANLLCRYLGEEGGDCLLDAAIAMCNPFNLPLADKNFQNGFNRIYDANLARNLRNIYIRNRAVFEEAALRGDKAFDTDKALNAASIRDFDEAITAPAFGWPTVDAYYQGSSSADSIPNVRVPLLVIQAEDDPIAPKEAIPFEALHQNPRCLLVLTPTGGHLGWCSGPSGPTGCPWTDKPVQEALIGLRKLLAQPEFSRAHAVQQEPEGVYMMEQTTHQAP